MYIITRLTDILNHNFLTCDKAEIYLAVCIEVNGEKFPSHAVTLTLIGQCQMSNSSELFPYTTVCSSFKRIEPLFFELSCTQADRHTHTDGHEYSIVAVDKPQIYYYFSLKKQNLKEIIIYFKPFSLCPYCLKFLLPALNFTSLTHENNNKKQETVFKKDKATLEVISKRLEKKYF